MTSIQQLRLPLAPEPAPSKHSVIAGGRAYPVQIVRHRRARRYLLRVGPDDTLRLTVPRGASIAGGLAFAAGQGPWIERERVRQQRRTAPWGDGTRVLWRGCEQSLRVSAHAVAWGDERIARPPGAVDVRAVFEAHVRRMAAGELPARCLELAARHGLSVRRVVVRSQRSRWGSCSPNRTIALNWRLLQMPPRVCEYILLHELMHLRQPNHSRRFWREVASVCDDWRESERWLRKHGRELL